MTLHFVSLWGAFFGVLSGAKQFEWIDTLYFSPRFGHSLVTSRVEMANEKLGKQPFNLSEHFFDTSLVCDGRLDELVTGMCFQGAETVNHIVSDGLRNRLFPHKNNTFGSDLAVRNIMVRV